MAKIDDSVKKKVPELRFPGFTDDWEERKAKEMIKTHHFRSYLAEPNDVGNYEVIQQGDKPIAGYANGEPFEYFYDVTLFGDHTVSLFKPTKPFFIATDGVKIISADEFDGRYFYVTLERYKPASQGYKRHFTILKNEDIWFTTNKDEQVKIGTFFKQLDETIALHQRKLDLLKEQKKGYLQKMFPKNGAKVPELRFAGFADDWEERKLGDHAKYRRGSFPQPYGNKEWYDGEGAMPFVQVVDVTNKLTLVENTKQKISKLAQSKSVFVPKGKVVVTLQGSIGRVAITQYDSFVDRTLLIFEDYEKETDERFWAYTIQKKFEIEKIKAPGGTIKTITKEALSSFDVHLPKFEEQQKIGSFFKQLDDIIALHQRKLDLLKEQKKGFLQKMFV